MNNRRRHRSVQVLGLVGLAVLLALLVTQKDFASEDDRNAPMVRTLSDGRSGLFYFRSHSLDRYDVVRDRIRREPVAISARLDLPGAARDLLKVPAAVLLHGSDGLTELQTRYARALVERGVATLVIDSFSGREIQSTIGNQNILAADAMVVDAYAALALLSTHPRIDSQSIAVIGWSKGGIASLWSARKSFRRRFATTGQQFAAHVAFYPWCGEREADIVLTGAPLLVLSGALDDWSGARPCIDYVEQAKMAGYDARIVVYQNAHHGFDYDGSFHTFLPRAVNWSECVYLARQTGFTVANSGWFSPWPDLNRYLGRCSSQGTHVASNSRARQRVKSDLFGFLSSVLMSRG